VHAPASGLLTLSTDVTSTEGKMAEQHKPGEIVKTSGIYKVVHEGDSKAAFEVTCVEGEHF
jgi:hypothetical protein